MQTSSMMPSRCEAADVAIRPEPAGITVQRQAQADRDACDRLLKAIFDRGLGQRRIARVTGIPLSTVQRALQKVIYPYRQDRPIEDARRPGRTAGSS
jgi:DNA invertase Pin-like site-specific DNA recombinase